MIVKSRILYVHFYMAVAGSMILGSHTFAEELPLWELGLGIGALHQPYYPGSNQTRGYAFPVPVPVYRGKIFKSDDEGLRAELFDDERYKLDISMDFNLAIEVTTWICVPEWMT